MRDGKKKKGKEREKGLGGRSIEKKNVVIGRRRESWRSENRKATEKGVKEMGEREKEISR